MNESKVPVWIAFPKIPWGSIGWRMGPGEDYWHAWAAWFKAMTTSEREHYRAQWPEPDGWKDFYNFIATGELPGWFLEQRQKIAESAIPPQPGEDEIHGYHRVLWLLRSHFKRISVERPAEDECIAEIHAAPDGTQWRLSAHVTRGGMHFKKLPHGS